MIIPVMGKYIKAHPSVKILHILFAVSGQQLCQLHQTVIIKTWFFEIKLQ